MKYEILEHTADLKIKVFAEDKKELFENAMLGMFESAGYKAVGNSESFEREIKVYTHDLISLLVDFLSEVLYLSEVEQEIYDKVEFLKFQEDTSKIDSLRFSLEAVLIGKKLKSRETLIKGVTYHDLKISQLTDGSWETVILFDI
jgi:SHS2 domain-containing protein